MYSEAGADFLKRHLDGGKVYNDFDIGGYLLWKEIPVFVDGRIAPYVGTEVLNDFFRIYGGRLELLDRYGIDWIYLPYGRAGQVDAFNRLNRLIRASGQWALVYWDDASLIYVRRAEKYSPVIKQHEYRYVNPAIFDFSPLPREYLGELKRKLAEEPGALMPRIMAGNYFFYNGDAAMAEREFEKVLESDPDNAVVHNNLGNTYLRQGRVKEAMASYKKSVKIDVNLGLAYCNWGYALEAVGEVKQAVKLYNIATKVTPGDPWPHNRMGVIEMKRGNRAKALEHWRKGAAIDPSSEAAQNLRRETEVR
jgi:tetratricopeptide (TPR) repeat protein